MKQGRGWLLMAWGALMGGLVTFGQTAWWMILPLPAIMAATGLVAFVRHRRERRRAPVEMRRDLTPFTSCRSCGWPMSVHRDGFICARRVG